MYGTTRAWPIGAGLLLGMVLLLAAPRWRLAAEQTRSSGVLARGAGYAEPQGSPAGQARSSARCARQAHSPGKVDGMFGPRTARRRAAAAAALRHEAGRRGRPADAVGARRAW